MSSKLAVAYASIERAGGGFCQHPNYGLAPRGTEEEEHRKRSASTMQGVRTPLDALSVNCVASAMASAVWIWHEQ